LFSRKCQRVSVVVAVAGTAAIIGVVWASTGAGPQSGPGRLALQLWLWSGVAAWVASLGLWAVAGLTRNMGPNMRRPPGG
jgi:hypothetical protein